MGENILENQQYSLTLKYIEKGLYVFEIKSGTGKTCLCNTVKRCRLYGRPVSAYSYDDLSNGLRPLDICKPTDRIVVFDRYDIYAGLFDDDIRALAEKTTVFLATKTAAGLPMRYRMCTLYMDRPNAFRIIGG